MRRSNIIGCEGITSACSDVCVGSNYRPLEAHQTFLGCRNLVLAPSHTTSGETLVRTLRNVAKRASITGIFLAKSPLNLGQAHTSQHGHMETYQWARESEMVSEVRISEGGISKDSNVVTLVKIMVKEVPMRRAPMVV